MQEIIMIMKSQLEGMYWNPDIQIFPLEKTDTESCVDAFQKNLPDMIWNTLSIFENNPATSFEIETILQGVTVAGLSLSDFDQIRNFSTASNLLIQCINTDTFYVSKELFCFFHSAVAKDETLEWGRFRSSSVENQTGSYIPPSCKELAVNFEKGMNFLATIQDHQLRAISLFLFCSRERFFYDANKRTALLMMYGELMKYGILPPLIQTKHQVEFNQKLQTFYETGDATEMLCFISETSF